VNDKELIQWLFLEFLKMESRAEHAEKELAEANSPAIQSVLAAASLRRWRGGPKRKD